MESYSELITAQRNYFYQGQTLAYQFRIDQLNKLKRLVLDNEEAFIAALKKDLNKPALESLTGEIALIIEDINFTLKHLKKWMQAKKVSTPLPLMPGKSQLIFEPYGSVLIIGPWNYPLLLTFSPLIGAIAAGNCAIVKPSEHAAETEKLIIELFNANFPKYYIHALKADSKQTAELLKERFDYIFFTGGTQIGKIIMAAAAQHLTPVTLELGGKSPCIIDESANLEYAARRIILAKMMNAGQICIAPDYLIIHQSIKFQFLQVLLATLKKFYTDNPQTSESYGRIINKNHFLRLKKLIAGRPVLIGGETNEEELYFAPTLVDAVTWDDTLMEEEIFGPILPILTFTDIDQVIQKIRAREKPLAFYYFGNNKINEQKFLAELSFGGGCINDCLAQILNVNLPFGGVGSSGIGNYHGKYSFETFSHVKAIYKKSFITDLGFPYPPYTDRQYKWVKRILNWWHGT